jgi:transcription termination/antitermination protein NusA
MKIPLDSLRDVERERGISYETLLEAMERALAPAYLRITTAPPETMRARAFNDRNDGDVTVYAQEGEVDPETEEATVLREWEDTPADFGRVAAQTFKQVMAQRLREVERDITYGEYAGREGDIVTGILQEHDHRYTILDLGKTEALMPMSEQIPHERYEHGMRLKAYIFEVRKSARGPQIIVSRTHPGLIKRLFELEVPEIYHGQVEIMPGDEVVALTTVDLEDELTAALLGRR